MVESPTRITRIGLTMEVAAGVAANVAAGAPPPAHANKAAAARKRNFIFALFTIKERRASRHGARHHIEYVWSMALPSNFTLRSLSPCTLYRYSGCAALTGVPRSQSLMTMSDTGSTVGVPGPL